MLLIDQCNYELRSVVGRKGTDTKPDMELNTELDTEPDTEPD